ncbi:hypothetical protein [Williamsia sp. 1138]|uniref:hypothetical protein n=1 Tax=Williamsia sp. 1138 TaxID=1903117 RepID=UPI001FF06EC1|nr:hypothetical protein [Williamsia sp. 1138]
MSSPAPARIPHRLRISRLLSPPVVVAAVSLLTLGLAGCGSDDDQPPPPAPTGCATDSTAGQSAAALLPVPPAKVTVLDPGLEPRSVPSSGFDRANAQSAQLVTTSTSSSPTTDRGPATTATTVDLPLTARVNCSDATDIDLRIGAAGSPDTALNQALKAQEGSRAGMSIGPGVVPISLRILPGKDADDTARQAVEESLFATFQRSVTLPTEPVGVGARWEAVRTVNAGATVRQTITATLTKREGDVLTVDYSVDESPVDSTFRLPDGGVLTIESYSMTGTGTVVVDLARGVPVSGQSKISGGRTLIGADASQPFSQLLGFESTWSPGQ